jgi:hypothetical protein
MMTNAGDKTTIHRTSHPDCPACREGRIHKALEWLHYHPENRTGIIDGVRHDAVKGKL